MKINVGFKPRSVLITSLLACMAFIFMAIFGWDLPVESALKFLVFCVVLLVVIILAAFLVLALFKWLKSLLG